MRITSFAASLFAAILATGCGRHGTPATTPDTTPPGAVTDLRATAVAPHTIRLTWTASGDDGSQGTAARYDIRYQTTDFPTGGHFPPADTVPNAPNPSPPGQSDSVLVADLPTAARYYFALRVADDAGLWSERSNVATVVPLDAPDDTPPAAVTDLRVQSVTNESVTLAWTAVGDDGTTGQADHYELRYAESPITLANWALATPAGGVPVPTAPGTEQTSRIPDLEFDHTYHFALRTVDESGNASALSSSVQASTSHIRVWRIRADGSGDAPTIQAGIDAAVDQDTVLVEAGVYHENHVRFEGKAIHVVSRDGPEATTIDADHDGAAVLFLDGEGRSSVLEGFTLTHGAGFRSREAPTIGKGGGIYCLGSSPIIRGNIFRDNNIAERNGSGAGIWVGDDSVRPIAFPLIEHNTFRNNVSAGKGGGCAFRGSGGEIIGNLFEGNICGYDGAGFFAFTDRGSIAIRGNVLRNNQAGDHGGGANLINAAGRADPYVISDNLFIENEARGLDAPAYHNGAGGGLALAGTFGVVKNNTFWGNTGLAPGYSAGGALLLYGTDERLSVTDNLFCESQGHGVAFLNGADPLSVRDNIFWNNLPLDWGAEYCDECDISTMAEHNQVVDPLFCDPVAGDFHVRSDSPARTGAGVKGALDGSCGGALDFPYHRAAMTATARRRGHLMRQP